MRMHEYGSSLADDPVACTDSKTITMYHMIKVASGSFPPGSHSRFADHNVRSIRPYCIDFHSRRVVRNHNRTCYTGLLCRECQGLTVVSATVGYLKRAPILPSGKGVLEKMSNYSPRVQRSALISISVSEDEGRATVNPNICPFLTLTAFNAPRALKEPVFWKHSALK